MKGDEFISVTTSRRFIFPPELKKATAMRPIVTLADLLAASQIHIETEDELSLLIHSAAELAVPDQGLAFGLLMLADMPAEIAASHMGNVTLLAHRLHTDTDGPAICRAVAQALAQFADE